jgi:hypothetical protein
MPRAVVIRYLSEMRRVLCPAGRVCFQLLDNGKPESYKRNIDTANPKEQSLSYSVSLAVRLVERAGLQLDLFEREDLEADYPGRGFSWLWFLAVC